MYDQHLDPTINNCFKCLCGSDLDYSNNNKYSEFWSCFNKNNITYIFRLGPKCYEYVFGEDNEEESKKKDYEKNNKHSKQCKCWIRPLQNAECICKKKGKK